MFKLGLPIAALLVSLSGFFWPASAQRTYEQIQQGLENTQRKPIVVPAPSAPVITERGVNTSDGPAKRNLLDSERKYYDQRILESLPK